MKRNLSSQAIRAMAIGMAVTMGSATAVSGVVTGTVVNAYASTQENGDTKPNASGNKHIEYQMGEVFLNFEITNEDNNENNENADNGKAKLVSITINSKNESSAKGDGTEQKPFKGEISNDMLKVTYNGDKRVYFDIDTIGNGTNPLSEQPITIDGIELAKITKKLQLIEKKAFRGITVNGDLDFSSTETLEDIKDEAFYGTTINGNLTLKGKISAPVKYKNATNSADVEETKKVFTNLTVTGNLDVSGLTVKESTDNDYPNKGGLSVLGLGFREGEKTKEEKGVKVEGKLIVPNKGFKLDNFAFRNVEVGELDLTNTELKAPGNQKTNDIVANSSVPTSFNTALASGVIIVNLWLR